MKNYNSRNLSALFDIVEKQQKNSAPHRLPSYYRILENISGSLIMQALKNGELLTTERTAKKLLNQWEKAKHNIMLTVERYDKSVNVTFCGCNELGMTYFIPLVIIYLH